jgi:hypothetical protein
MRGPVESFRMAFGTLVIFMVVAGVLLLAAALGLVFLVLPPAAGVPVLLIAVLGVGMAEVLFFLGAGLLILLFKIDVGPEGLRCPNAWGGYGFAAWDDVRSVRPINILGLRYLRVFTTTTVLPLWVPLFLADPDGFRAALLRCAGPTHPLTVAFAEHA